MSIPIVAGPLCAAMHALPQVVWGDIGTAVSLVCSYDCSSYVMRAHHHCAGEGSECDMGATAAGEEYPVLFYGRGGRFGFLSQMYESRFEADGKTFSCNEQYFQYAKAELFGDKKRAAAILLSQSPYEMKAIGRKVSLFSVERWAKGELASAGSVSCVCEGSDAHQFPTTLWLRRRLRSLQHPSMRSACVQRC
jgi:hypothetical protein